MQYRLMGKTNVLVSALGFGCMRLPVLNNNDSHIDIDEAKKMVRYAIDNGLNYIDTAFMYHGGKSEEAVGEILSDGYREKVFLATKSPIWGFKSPEDFDKHLDIQLERLKTDHIDFYLFHALSLNSWEDVVIKLNLFERMEEAKRKGKIKYIGFSFHDNYEVFVKILNGYDNWDFCQIQLNYIDIGNQAGIKGLKAAAGKGLGVIVMEPLLGGKLSNPAENLKSVLPADKTPTQTALDFLWDMPEVSLILSGMSTFKHVSDNIKYAGCSYAGMLEEKERLMYKRAKTVYETMSRVPCTKCLYCMPCPYGVDIPTNFEAYNKTTISKEQAEGIYEKSEGKSDLCRSCKKCEKKCPQKIEISGIMGKITEYFEGVKK